MIRLKSIRTRYMLAVMTICVASLLLISGVSYLVSSRITADLSDIRISELATSKAREFDTWFEIKEMIIAGMAQDIEAAGDFSDLRMQVLTKNKMRLYAKEVQDFYVGYADKAGHVISGVGWVPPAEYDQRVRPWFVSATKTDKVIFTDPYVDAMSGHLVITVARSLRQDGQVVAVLATDIFIGDIIELVTSLRISENSYALLLDEEGKIIAHPNPEFQPTPKGLKSAESVSWSNFGYLVSLLLHGNFSDKISLIGPTGQQEYFMFSQMRKNNWFFGISISKAQYEKPLRLLLFGFMGAFVLSVFGGGLVMLRFVSNMIRPIRILTQAVETFADNDFSARAEVLSEDEVGSLARSFNKMAATIQEHNQTLELKVEERTRELQAKNTLIMDSIGYARRLQNAILPTLHLHAGLDPTRCFAIWQPRDTVGGDMYWCRTEGSFSLIVVGDCTGHGVPGALMTMTLNSILDSTLRETGFVSPARIMGLIHTRFKQNLRQDEANTKIDDGADVSMLLVDRENRTLVFCGAHMSIFVWADGELREIRGGKQSIGYSRNKTEVRFEDISIPWQPDTRIYMTTDGLLDQPLKPQTVGMGKGGFQQLLETMMDLDMVRQRVEIEREMEQRLSAIPQRDDMCVVGLDMSNRS